VRGWKISMTSLMKCAPARSTVASFWKLREQARANYLVRATGVG
jgi:hypothetical protein